MMTKTPHLIFIHGLSNKPPAEDLKRIWLEALAERRDNNPGFDLSTVGVRETFIYWADYFMTHLYLLQIMRVAVMS